MLLDEMLPGFEFSEHHETEIAAPPERVRETLLALEPRDLRLTQLLLLIRLLPRRLAGRAPSLTERRPLFEFGAEYGFVPLADTEREVVYGIADRFWRLRTSPARLADRDAFIRFAEPGYAKAAFNFLFEPAGDGTRVVTETRIHGIDDEARRKFGRYWLLIRAASGLTRRDILAAVRRRAERAKGRSLAG